MNEDLWAHMAVNSKCAFKYVAHWTLCVRLLVTLVPFHNDFLTKARIRSCELCRCLISMEFIMDGERLPWWKTTLMKDRPYERPPWWETTLIKDYPDERPPWWETTLMKDHPDEKPPWWETTLMRDHPDERPPWWKMRHHFDERPVSWLAGALSLVNPKGSYQGCWKTTLMRWKITLMRDHLFF